MSITSASPGTQAASEGSATIIVGSTYGCLLSLEEPAESSVRGHNGNVNQNIAVKEDDLTPD